MLITSTTRNRLTANHLTVLRAFQDGSDLLLRWPSVTELYQSCFSRSAWWPVSFWMVCSKDYNSIFIVMDPKNIAVLEAHIRHWHMIKFTGSFNMNYEVK